MVVSIYIVAPATFSKSVFVSNLRTLVVGNSSNATKLYQHVEYKLRRVSGSICS